jgi:hypothetical protein
MLVKYNGNEAAMLRALETKYGKPVPLLEGQQQMGEEETKGFAAASAAAEEAALQARTGTIAAAEKQQLEDRLAARETELGAQVAETKAQLARSRANAASLDRERAAERQQRIALAVQLEKERQHRFVTPTKPRSRPSSRQLWGSGSVESKRQGTVLNVGSPTAFELPVRFHRVPSPQVLRRRAYSGQWDAIAASAGTLLSELNEAVGAAEEAVRGLQHDEGFLFHEQKNSNVQ